MDDRICDLAHTELAADAGKVRLGEHGYSGQACRVELLHNLVAPTSGWICTRVFTVRRSVDADR